MSVASTLDTQGVLAASFFWDKNRPGSGLDSLDRFPSTLARQLAAFSPYYRITLFKRLRQPALDNVLQDFTLKEQMEALILDPMHEIKEWLSLDEDRWVIILDGLNECGDPEALEKLMEIVLMLDKLPPRFTVLISCRRERQLDEAWTKFGCFVPCEDIDKTNGEEKCYTIRRIVEEGLKEKIRGSQWKPSLEDLNAFARSCRGLPILAAIQVHNVCRRIRGGSTLEEEFQSLRDTTGPVETINNEYLRILR